jgi:hypothetical protein
LPSPIAVPSQRVWRSCRSVAVGAAGALRRQWAERGVALRDIPPLRPYHIGPQACAEPGRLDRSELAGFSGWIRAGGGMAAGGFPSGRHSIMTERTPLFGYVRSKPLIPHEWPAHTRTLLPQFPQDGAVPAHLSADQIKAVEEDMIVCNGVNQI